MLIKNNNNISLTNYTIQQLIKNNVHIGEIKNLRNNDNNNFIFNSIKNIDIINVQKTLETLKLILPTIINIIIINGKILTVLNTQQKHIKINIVSITKNTRQRFLFFWKPGLLSNYKEFRRQKKYYTHKNIFFLPNFIIFLNDYTHHIELKTEIKSLKIPCVRLQTSIDKDLNFFYTLPSNKKNLNIKLFFINLISNAIFQGYSKKILSFSNKYYKK
jgi:ribosomal protein S2